MNTNDNIRRKVRFRLTFGGVIRLCVVGWLAYQLICGTLVRIPLWQAAICWFAAVSILLFAIMRFIELVEPPLD